MSCCSGFCPSCRSLPEPSAQGGRPPISHEVVLQVLWFALRTGTPWRTIPKAMGCSGETGRTRILTWAQRQIWDRNQDQILNALRAVGVLDLETVVVDSTLVRAHGGGAVSGPNPMDRRKPGTKFTLIVDGQGVPLELRTRPKRLYADAGDDSAAARSLLKPVANGLADY